MLYKVFTSGGQALAYQGGSWGQVLGTRSLMAVLYLLLEMAAAHSIQSSTYLKTKPLLAFCGIMPFTKAVTWGKLQ